VSGSTFDWQVEAFYSFVIEIPGEPWFRVSFDPRDVMALRGAMMHGRQLSFGKSITEDWQANP
jgi:hypothetical protein